MKRSLGGTTTSIVLLGRAGVAVLALTAIFWGLAAMPTQAAGVTVNVNTTSDEPTPGMCSLREALLYAGGTPEADCSTAPLSGTTTINVPAGVYILTEGVLALKGNVALAGAGAPITTIDAASSSQPITVNTGAIASIAGVTVTGGVTGLTMCTEACPPTVPKSGVAGGGIENFGTLTLNGVFVTGNRTASGTTASSFFCSSGCSAGDGGAGGGIENFLGTLTITNSTIANNTTGAGGDGQFGSPATAPGGAGGAGGSGGDGGGIDNFDGTVTITNSTIANNTTGAGGNGGTGGSASSGGGAGGDAGSSGAGGSGGAIENSGSLTITGSTIFGNKTGTGGAGAHGGNGSGGRGGDGSTGNSGGSGAGIDSSTNLSITNSTITGNTTAGGGAGATGGTGTFTGATGGPGQPGNGGGMNQSMAGATLTHLTIDGNTAAGSGGGLSDSGGSFTVTNSIVAANQGAPATAANCGGMLTDGGGNIGFGGTCPAGFLNADPKLAPLENNGGATQTMALLAGSAAIHHVATCVLSSDQRAVSRPVGAACDSGAYEFAPPALTSPSAAGTSTTTGTVGASINPNLSARDTTVTVNYGTTTAYGSTTTAQDIGAGNSPVPFSAGLTGLAPATAYHAQIIATNADGESASGDITFTTASPPPPLAASLGQTTVSGDHLQLTIACGGGTPGQTCTGQLALTSHVTEQGGSPIAVAASKPKKKPKPKRVTSVATVGSGSYSVATGASTTLSITLNSKGQKLLTRLYTLPATLELNGTTTLTSTVTFRYAVVKSPISFTWTFGPHSTSAQQLLISKIPSKGKVEVACSGGGCPFAARTFKPHGGKVDLTSSFKHGLKPHATLEIEITAANEVAKVAIFKIQSGQQPTLTELCLPPGAHKPARCAH